MSSPDLAQEAAELLSITNSSEHRSLNQLVSLATRQVAGCSGAAAALWRGGEPVILAASHPDLPALIEVQLSCCRGPVLAALAAGGTVSSADTLAEDRWPEYAGAALRLGVRCSVDLVCQAGAEAVTLSIFGARPRRTEHAELAIAELLIAFGGAVLGNAAEYGDARRTALQLRAAARARTLVDQAKGMLMHELGCSADQALTRMRQVSQARNLKVTEVASAVIDAGGFDGLGRPARNQA